MPLEKSRSRDAFVRNLKTELRAGKAKDQALAIAYAVKRRAKRAAGGQVEELPDVGQPLIGDGGQFSAGTPWANHAAERLSSLPGRMIEGAARDISTPGALMKPNPYPAGSEEAEWYDNDRDRIAREWGPGMALNTMGAGTFAGPVRAAGEMVAGAGPVRRLPSDVATAAPEVRPAVTQRDNFSVQKVDGGYDAMVGKRKVGRMLLEEHPENGTQAFGVFVQPRYRRQGVASSMYDFAEKDIGRPINPSSAQTEEAFQFWKNRNPDMLNAQQDMRMVRDHLLGEPVETMHGPGRIERVSSNGAIVALDGKDTTSYVPKKVLSQILERKGVTFGSGPTDRRAAAGLSTLADVDRAIAAEKELANGPRSGAVPAEQPAAAPAGEVGPGGGGQAGAAGLPEAQATAARWAGERKPLEGLPGALKIGEEHFVPGPIGKIHDVAEDYMRTHHPDRPYTPPTRYHPLDPEHSKAIAQAYEEMQHTPNDPATRASYDALIKETADQYQAIKKTGLQIEPIPPGAVDPYAANPRLAARDVAENNHLWFFPTEQGFGTVNKISDNPMLRNTGEKIGDHQLLANDMFRIVHDYFGHLKEGHGFRAPGEDNAWRTHSAMYSDLARPAMTTETRGQNSWVNYGPHGEKNRTASAADTTYADQKVGLMPEWTMRDRNSPAPIMVYHGTPYTFDRFSMSKIGAGEGNQAYGHGLYFAGHEPVSEWYRHQLAARNDPRLKKYGLQEVGHVIGSHLSDVGGDAAKLAAKYAEKRNELIASGLDDKATANMIKEYDQRIRYLNDPKRNRGQMYQVAMDVNPEHLLDYDNPFHQQTGHVQERTGPDMEQSVKQQIEAIHKVLEKGGMGNPGSRFYRPMSQHQRQDLEGRLLMLEQTGPASLQGKDIYKRMGLPAVNETEGNIRASQRLRDVGVPGLRYKDAGSRAPGQKGSHNYVMFDDQPLSVFRRYERGGAVERAMRVARRTRASGGPVEMSPEDQAAMMPETFVNPLVSHAVEGAANFVRRPAQLMAPNPYPEGSEEAAWYDDNREKLSREWARDAALSTMGTGAMAGVRAVPRDVVLGAGPVRRIADDTGSAVTKAPAVVGRAKLVDPDTGMAIAGPAYTKEAQAVNREIAAGPKGAGPLDLSLQGQVPDVPQVPMERYVPPRGISPRMMEAMDNPSVRAGLEDSMRAGAGVRDWYHTEPVRQAFIEAKGPVEGEAAFKRYMDLVAATSPRSDVPTNIRNASYYYTGADPTKTNPYPYGHVAQNLHKQNVGTVTSEGGWDIMKNPKPASFAANLRGNLEPVTVDTHAFRNIGMRTGDPRFLETSLSNIYRDGHSAAEDTLAGRYGELKQSPKGTIVTYRPQQLAEEGRLSMEDAKKIPAFWAAHPKANEYAAAEQMFRDAGNKVGMRPADAQAAAWAGGGDMTGLGTVGTHTFPELMNERITFTARMRGESPQKVLDDFTSGRRPLLNTGGAVNDALRIARDIKRASGGKVHVGPIMGDTDGRADEVPMEVPDGAYVLTADHVSSMGEGNTLSGFKKLNQMFPESAKARASRSVAKRAAGGAVPIYAADGEYVICPQDIINRWGDLDEGHRYLDAWQTASRKEHVDTLRNLAPPAQD